VAVDSFIQGPADGGGGRKLDSVQVTTGAGLVEREGVFIGDPDTPGTRAKVATGAPGGGDAGLVTRPVALPLPTGASTEFTLAAILAALKGPTAAVVTRPSVGAGSTQILAANAARKSVVITNEHATQDLYIKHGAGASTTSYTWVAQSGFGTVRIPQPAYTGAIEAIYSGGGTQVCEVTEET
jgi:hypothetical protein